MRLILLFAIVIFSNVILIAQKKSHDKQEFLIRDLKFISRTEQFNPNVEISFDLITKYTLNDIETEGNSMFATYRIKCWLGDQSAADSLTGIIYDRNYTMMSDAIGEFVEATSISIKIPYVQFRKSGLQNCRLYCLVESESGAVQYPVTSSQEIKLNILKTYPLSEQEITINNLKITTPSNPTDGKLFQFNYKFKYNEKELYPNEGDNVSYNNRVYYFVNIYDENNHQIGLHTNVLLNSVVVSQQKDLPGKYTVLIPYTEMNLAPGKYNLTYKLCAATSDGNYKWNNLDSGIIELLVPQKYLTKVKLTNIGLHETKYDVAGQDVPLLNIFMNQRKSSGKGYPDIYWSLNNKSRIIHTSGISKNAFYFTSDSILLQTLSEDNLSYSVYDDDFFGKDDLIGKLNMAISPSKNNNFKKLSFGGIKSGEITVTRKTFEPNYLEDINLISSKVNGVTGYLLTGNWSEGKDQHLNFQIVQEKDTLKSGLSLIQQINELKGQFSYLIPAFLINRPFKVIISLDDEEINMKLAEKVIIIDKMRNEIDDVQLKVLKSTDTYVNGVKGFDINLHADFPTLYDQSLLKFDFHLSDKGRILHAGIINKNDLNGNIFCNETKCNTKIFIPYFIVNNYNPGLMKGLQPLYFDAEITSGSNVIGKIHSDIEINLPEFISINYPTIELKPNKNKWSKMVITTTHFGISNQTVIENDGSKSITYPLNIPFKFIGSEDNIYFEYSVYDQSGNLVENSKFEMQGKSFKEKSIKLQTSEYFKSIKLVN